LQIGKEGLTDAASRSLRDAFNTRELLKAKVLENAPEAAREIAATLAERIEGAQVVQVIGRTVVLYRPHPNKPEIQLPR
jgi:RNA-binding protein